MNSEQFGSTSDYNGYNDYSEYNMPDATKDDVNPSYFEPSMPDERSDSGINSNEGPRWIGDFAKSVARDLSQEEYLRKQATTNHISDAASLSTSTQLSDTPKRSSSENRVNNNTMESTHTINTSDLSDEKLAEEIRKSREIALDTAVDELVSLEKQRDKIWDALKNLKYTEAELDKAIDAVNKIRDRLEWLNSYLNKLLEELDAPDLMRPSKQLSETRKLEESRRTGLSTLVDKKDYYDINDSFVSTDPEQVLRGKEGGMPPKDSSDSGMPPKDNSDNVA